MRLLLFLSGLPRKKSFENAAVSANSGPPNNPIFVPVQLVEGGSPLKHIRVDTRSLVTLRDPEGTASHLSLYWSAEFTLTGSGSGSYTYAVRTMHLCLQPLSLFGYYTGTGPRAWVNYYYTEATDSLQYEPGSVTVTDANPTVDMVWMPPDATPWNQPGYTYGGLLYWNQETMA